MASSGSILDHPSSVRALLLERRPELERRLVVGPSGALVIPLPTGGGIEIGRMRRRGEPRWVVVMPGASGAMVREPRTLDGVARTVLGALDGIGIGRR
jgi:hypothetical protein